MAERVTKQDLQDMITGINMLRGLKPKEFGALVLRNEYSGYAVCEVGAGGSLKKQTDIDTPKNTMKYLCGYRDALYDTLTRNGNKPVQLLHGTLSCKWG